jgi:hypothetical protein
MNIGVFWKRESIPIEWRQCRLLTRQFFLSAHIYSLFISRRLSRVEWPTQNHKPQTDKNSCALGNVSRAAVVNKLTQRQFEIPRYVTGPWENRLFTHSRYSNWHGKVLRWMPSLPVEFFCRCFTSLSWGASSVPPKRLCLWFTLMSLLRAQPSDRVEWQTTRILGLKSEPMRRKGFTCRHRCFQHTIQEKKKKKPGIPKERSKLSFKFFSTNHIACMFTSLESSTHFNHQKITSPKEF